MIGKRQSLLGHLTLLCSSTFPNPPLRVKAGLRGRLPTGLGPALAAHPLLTIASLSVPHNSSSIMSDKRPGCWCLRDGRQIGSSPADRGPGCPGLPRQSLAVSRFDACPVMVQPSELCYVFLASAAWNLPLLTSLVSLAVFIKQRPYNVLISSCLLRKFQVEQTSSVGRHDPSTVTSHNCCGHI